MKKNDSKIKKTFDQDQKSATSISPNSSAEELTVEKLFENYEGEYFKSDLVSFEPIGKEKW